MDGCARSSLTVNGQRRDGAMEYFTPEFARMDRESEKPGNQAWEWLNKVV
jgi:hypothetical protein